MLNAEIDFEDIGIYVYECRMGILAGNYTVGEAADALREGLINDGVLNNPKANAQFLANLPMGRWGKVEEIGALACYLCSESAGFITGTDILIDGGWTAK